MNFFRTTWNILKPVLGYYLILFSSFLIFVVASETVLVHQLSQGVIFDIELKVDMLVDRYFFPIATLIAAIGIYLIYRRKMKKNNMNLFKVYRFKKLPLSKAIACFVAGVSAILLAEVYFGIIYFLAPELINISGSFPSRQGVYFLAFITTGLITPIIEEFIFRGIIFDELERKTSIKLTILIQGILFGFFHPHPLVIGYFTIVGVLHGLIYVWTGSIWGPILMHMGNNLFLSFLTLPPIENFLNKYDVLYIIISVFPLLVFPVSIIYLYKNRGDFTYKNKTNIGQGS